MESIYESHIDFMGKDLAVNLWLSYAYTDGMIHWHENLEMLYFIKGECNVLNGSEEVHATPGDIVVINSGDIHSVKCQDNPCDFIILQFDFSFCEDMGFDMTDVTIKKLIRDDEIGKLITDAFNDFKNREEYYRQALKIKALSILLKMYRNYTILDNEKNSSYNKKMLSKKIVKYARHHFDENITVEDIAKHCGYSRFYISKTFKDVTGKTLVDFINTLKIHKAKSMLESTNFDIGEIASKCGFASQSYFSNVFKKHENISPFEYKNRFKKTGVS